MDLFVALDSSRDKFHAIIKKELENGIVPDYSAMLADEIMVEVARDVVETAAHGGWNDCDVRLAIGRVLMKKLGVEV